MLNRIVIASLALVALLVTACPKPPPGSRPVSQIRVRAALAPTCDPNRPLAVVSNVMFEVGKDARRALMLHEVTLPLDKDPFFTGTARGGNGWKQITRQQAERAGALRGATRAWVLGLGSDGEPEPREIVRYWAVRGGDGATFTAIKAELASPEPPTDRIPHTLYALRCRAKPAGLTWKPAQKQPVITATQRKAWRLPATMDAALLPSACKAPACQLKQALHGVLLGGEAAAFELTVSHVYLRIGVKECDWKSKNHHGVFFRAGAGQSARLLKGPGGLAGVVLKQGKPALLVSNEDGWRWLHRPAAGGGASLVAKTHWMIISEEERARRSLGPDCRP